MNSEITIISICVNFTLCVLLLINIITKQKPDQKHFNFHVFGDQTTVEKLIEEVKKIQNL